MTQVIEIQGVGPKLSAKLAKAGVTTIEALLEAGCSPQGRQALAEKSGIGMKRILRWVNHADLFRIHGVAGQYAELLEKAGVDTVVELSKRNADNLYAKCVEVNEEFNLVNNLPEKTAIAKWIEEAKTLPRKVTY